MIAFRDRLRSNSEDRLRYESEKRRLVKFDWPDTNAYAKAKTRVVEEIITRAIADAADFA